MGESGYSLDPRRFPSGPVHGVQEPFRLWIACNSYTLRYLDGRRRNVEQQLLPETVLRKRADHGR